MPEPFPIVPVPGVPERTEPIGSKEKFWVRDSTTGMLWLFKEARIGTGEHWAEKIAAEVAALLGLPHATVELAVSGDTPGILTKDFTAGSTAGELAHGNELLFELDPDYPKEARYRVEQHTLEAVQRVLAQDFVALPAAAWPPQVTIPWTAFLGYLMLDALIGNTDRHHQNWGILVNAGGKNRSGTLAPTFDHASSLGRELNDSRREHMLCTRDTRSNVEAYASRAKSALYLDASVTQLSPIEAFNVGSKEYPQVRSAWIEQLRRIPPAAIEDLVERIPGQSMSAPARDFALALLKENRVRLGADHV